jgi:hypothetical protein
VAFSPLLNPEKALRRRNLVLSEMESDGVITHAQAEQARALRSACTSRSRKCPSRRGSRKKSARARKALRLREVHEAGLRSKPRSTSTCSRPPIAPLPTAGRLRAPRHGWRGKLENVLAEGITLEDYRIPTGRSSRPRRLRSRPGHARCRLRFTPASGDQPAPRSSCCPPTGSGPASATATRSSNPATSSTST